MTAQDILSALTATDPSSAYQQIATAIGIPLGALFIILAVISIWSIVWKGFALWKSAKKNHMIWFIVILVVNTVGILEILYIYVFSKMGEKKSSEKISSVPVKKKKR